MATILNFKSVEVSGNSKDEILANSPFKTIMKDASQALKNAKKNHDGAWTSSDQKAWELSYLEKNTKNAEGVGCYYVIDAPVADTRERPYKYTNIKREGNTVTRTTYVWVDSKTGAEICKVVGTKDERATKANAAKAIKEVMANGEYKGKAKLFSRKEEEKPVCLATCEYTPSKSSKVGVYKVFGIEG